MKSDLTYSPPLLDTRIEFPPRLVLNQGFEKLEVVKKFILEFKEVNPTVYGKVIYECKDILGLNHGHMRKRTNNFTVDELNRCRGWLISDSLILML